MAITKISAAMADLDGSVTINEAGADADFRIESDNSANALFVQGSDGKVGINIAAPARRLLEIQDASPGIVLHDSDVTNLTHEIVGGGNAGLEISADYQNVGTGYIRFDVGGSERARILEGGGITFNGDTAAANALDDYEEGTWTPTITTGSITFAAARYTKIGRLIHVSAEAQAPNDITTSASVIISGLPYPVDANQASGSVMGTYSDNTGATTVYCTTAEKMYFYNLSNGSWNTLSHANFNSTSAYIYFQATYHST